MKAKQKWRCPVCKHEYAAAIPVFEVLCPNNHLPTRGRSARGVMQLIEGQLPKRKVPVGMSDPSPKRRNTSGN